MITQIIKELKNSPLSPVVKVDRNEYSLTLIGDNWSFSTVSSWRISKSKLFACGCYDPKAVELLENIKNLVIISVDIQSDCLSIDPVFVFSDQFMLEIFSTTFLEPWVFTLPSGSCYVASPSDPKDCTNLKSDSWLLYRGMMKWIANSKFLEPRSYEIKYDPQVGFYLYVFKSDKCIYDHLQDTLQIAIEYAWKEYGVPKNSWKKIEDNGNKLMKVFLEEIEQIFDELIQEKKPREQIASWASARQAANDIECLEFEPSTEKKKIWRAIIYLTGVDLKDIDGSYLHSIDNFIEFRDNAGLGKYLRNYEFKPINDEKLISVLKARVSDVKISAELIDDHWLMCPECIDGWESLSQDRTVTCPKCDQILRNPRYSKPDEHPT